MEIRRTVSAGHINTTEAPQKSALRLTLNLYTLWVSRCMGRRCVMNSLGCPSEEVHSRSCQVSGAKTIDKSG